MSCYPSLHCYWRKKNYEVCNSRGPTWEAIPYGGPALPSEFLSETLKEGFFHGEVFKDLFKALTVIPTKKGSLCYSLYDYVGDHHSDDMDPGLIYDMYEMFLPIKKKLLASDGELWLEKFKSENEYLNCNSEAKEYAKHYTREVVLSFIMMFEWYATNNRGNKITLYCYETYRQRRVDGKVEYIPYPKSGRPLWQT